MIVIAKKGGTRLAESPLTNRNQKDLNNELERLKKARRLGVLPKDYAKRPGSIDDRIRALQKALGHSRY